MKVEMRLVEPKPPRTCGPCTLCCKVLGVQELHKLPNTWCQHAKRPNGCRVYADRPHTCQTFRCLWLDGHLPDNCRPDRLHAVLHTTDEGNHLIICEDPGWPGHASQALRPLIENIHQRGDFVVVACGENYDVVAPPGMEQFFSIEPVEGGKFKITDRRHVRIKKFLESDLEKREEE